MRQEFKKIARKTLVLQAFLVALRGQSSNLPAGQAGFFLDLKRLFDLKLLVGVIS